jgi:hypothetical protein
MQMKNPSVYQIFFIKKIVIFGIKTDGCEKMNNMPFW